MLNKLKERMEAVARKGINAFEEAAQNNIVSDEVQQERYNICLDCTNLYKPTSTCKLCGCFMKAKTKLRKASCPIKKWTSLASE